MKYVLAAVLTILSSTVAACGQAQTQRTDVQHPEAQRSDAGRTEALRTLYADADIARYVCVENGECAFDEFARQLDVKPVNLGASPAHPAIQVEPQRKGAQYFSAIFLQEGGKYQLVFPPDVTMSDVKILKQQKNGYYLVRGVNKQSADAWQELDFAYDPKAGQYNLDKQRCYAARGGKPAQVKCD